MSNVRPSLRVRSAVSAEWPAPAMSAPVEHTVTSDPASRIISLSAGQDCIISSPDPISFLGGAFASEVDAVVTVIGGRNVIWEGARFALTGGPTATLTTDIDGSTLSIPADASGFPPAGFLRIEGELIEYSSVSPGQFNATTRNAGFYNGSTPGNYAHAAGATVYLGEYSRSGVSFRGQTGHVWLRDMQAAGFVNDGIRLNTTAQVTLQDIRIGPVTCHDLAGTTDGHPDCIQVWERGPSLIRVSRATLMAGVRGRCIWDFPSLGVTGAWDLRDVEVIDSASAVSGLIYSNLTTAAAWSVYAGWARTGRRRQIAVDVSSAIAEMFTCGGVTDSSADFVPAS